MPLTPQMRDLLLGGGLGAAAGALSSGDPKDRLKRTLAGGLMGAPLAMAGGALGRKLAPGTFGSGGPTAVQGDTRPTHGAQGSYPSPLNPATAPNNALPPRVVKAPSGRMIEVPGHLNDADVQTFVQNKDQLLGLSQISPQERAQVLLEHPHALDDVVSTDMAARMGRPGMDIKGMDQPTGVRAVARSFGSGWPGVNLMHRMLGTYDEQGIPNNWASRNLLADQLASQNHPGFHIGGELAPALLTMGGSAAEQAAGKATPGLASRVLGSTVGRLPKSTGAAKVLSWSGMGTSGLAVPSSIEGMANRIQGRNVPPGAE